jgi:hypothetical protein
MFKKFLKKVLREGIWAAKKKVIVQILTPRCRVDGVPEFGRFTPKDIQRIIDRTKQNMLALMPYFNDTDNIGNFLLQYGGLVDLAVYRALLAEKVDPNYAMALVGDMIWQARLNANGLVPVYDPLRKELAKWTTRGPVAFLERRLRDGMEFPYSEPGYRVEFYKEDHVYCMDFYSCIVNDFYQQFGKEEITMFRKTWCTFDFAVAEHLVEGGRYRRPHTLSDGDEVCDMRWFIEG